MFEAGGLVDELCVRRQNQLTAQHLWSRYAHEIFVPLVHIAGLRPPKRVREPGPQPVEPLHVVHREGAGAARTRQGNTCDSPPAIADHAAQSQQESTGASISR